MIDKKILFFKCGILEIIIKYLKIYSQFYAFLEDAKHKWSIILDMLKLGRPGSDTKKLCMSWGFHVARDIGHYTTRIEKIMPT